MLMVDAIVNQKLLRMASWLFLVTCRWLLRVLTRKKDYSSPDYYSSLPDDILEQILLKLQCIKSIVTCSSVCKSWHDFIKSRRFITTHLSRPYSYNAEYFLCFDFGTIYNSILCYNGRRLEKYHGLNFPERGVTVLGSCHGLICYTKFAPNAPTDIFLWNPTIRKLKLLPKSKYSERAVYGFWYDADSDDYKVVKVYFAEVSKVEVYSLSSNSWELITARGPSYSKVYDMVHLNGTLIWLISENYECKLISLNIKDRVYRETLIWPAERIRSSFIVLGTFGAGSRSLFVLRNSYENKKMDLLVYDESLNGLYRNEFEKSEKVSLHPLGVRNNGDVLFQKMGPDHRILVFDTRKIKFKDFSPSVEDTYIFRLIPFVETLVLLDDGHSSSTPNA